MEKLKYVCWDEFTPYKMGKLFVGKGKTKRTICNDFMSLDTETSNTHNENNLKGWIYQWAFKYGEYVVYGRKPSQMVYVLKKIVDINELDNKNSIIIYVHNLSYDYEYIKDFLIGEFGYNTTEYLAVDNHKLISFKIGGLEFRCSYRLSQKSLDTWAKELNTEHQKLVGTVDYSLIRYQDTELTNIDWKYMFHDVIVLDECIREQMKLKNDTLASLPLTSTGYVRRDTRVNFKGNAFNRNRFTSNRLYLDSYKACKKAFAGGLTHGNRFYAGQTYKGIIRHRDFASHYPSQQICTYAPISGFSLYFEKGDVDMSIKSIVKLSTNKCLLIKITISDMLVREGVTLPYAQASKFAEGRISEHYKTIEDNGRILKLEGASTIYVTELDLKWLIKQYRFNYVIEKVWTAKKGKFPDWLRNTVFDYFYKKTEYKQKVKAREHYCEENNINPDTDSELIELNRTLLFYKGLLNGIYGMSATDPVRLSYQENENMEWIKPSVDDDFIKGELEDYYRNYNSFMDYQLGVWTTAQARNELMEFYELIGAENFLYADTDSIFYISTPEIEARIEARNAEFRKENDENGYYIDYNGKRVYFNQFELEDEEIVKFRFLHAKCYAYELKNEELKVTIAGVSKYGRNNNTRVKELGNIEELKNGKVFEDCGGTSIKYIPHKCDTIDIDGHLTEYASSAIIMNVNKEIKGTYAIKEEFITWKVAEIC